MKKRKIGKKTLKALLLSITVLVAVLLVASAWGGMVNPHNTHVLPLLTLALPIILVANVVVMVAWLAAMRWRYALICFAAIVLAWLPVRSVFPINLFAGDIPQGASSFKVMTFNTMNFGPYDPSNHSPSLSMRYILDQDADFVLLQEGSQERDYLKLSNVVMMRDELVAKYPYHSDGYHDVMILSKYPYKVLSDSMLKRTNNSPHAVAGSYQVFARAFDIELPGDKQLRIINVHLHSVGLDQSDKDLYMKITENEMQGTKSELKTIKNSLLDKLMASYRNRSAEAVQVRNLLDQSPQNVILCGDFNDTPASYTYRTIMGNDMRDTFTECGNGFAHTYHDNRFYFKIDHIMYRGSLDAVAWKRDKSGDSDHYPQVATFVWK